MNRVYTPAQLASKVAKTEGKKHQASVGDVRELLGIVADLMWTDPRVYYTLAVMGYKRSRRKKRSE